MAATPSTTAPAPHPQDRLLREGAGAVDRSERGKLALTGPGALEFLNGQVTNELDGLRSGEGRYAAFLTHKGHMLGDLRVLAAGGEHAGEPEELLLDTERVALQALFDMIRRFRVGYDVELHKRTLERGLVSVIGPHAHRAAGTEALAAAEEHANAPVQIGGVAALAIRTDGGVDLLCDASQTSALLAALARREAPQVDQDAAEALRIERGRPRYGRDIDDGVIPQEAGLNERAVSFTKGCYVGQETVARLFYRGRPNRHLRGLLLPARACGGEELRSGERVVGRIGSSAVSPVFGPIALALVRREVEPGGRVLVGGQDAEAEVVELPFARGR